MIGKVTQPAARRFLTGEGGAVTVDWVALICMVIALCVATVLAMSNASDKITAQTTSYMTEKTISP